MEGRETLTHTHTHSSARNSTERVKSSLQFLHSFVSFLSLEFPFFPSTSAILTTLQSHFNCSPLDLDNKSEHNWLPSFLQYFLGGFNSQLYLFSHPFPSNFQQERLSTLLSLHFNSDLNISFGEVSHTHTSFSSLFSFPETGHKPPTWIQLNCGIQRKTTTATIASFQWNKQYFVKVKCQSHGSKKWP